MQLAESLQKNILKTSVGGLWNKFKGKDRRDTLFFEDIVAEYVLLCEQNGYKKEMRLIGQEWMEMAIKELIPNTLKLIPSLFLNTIMKKIWINLGLVDDLYSTKNKNYMVVRTENEIISRVIGVNEISAGSYLGVLNVLYGVDLKLLNKKQNIKTCEYTYELTKNTHKILTKKREVYLKQNKLKKIPGFKLEDAVKANMIRIVKNKIYFRKMCLIPTENTIFHLFGNSGILINEVPKISHNYFKKIIESNCEDTKKLVLLKNILQAMGWGNINIILDNRVVLVKIDHPPIGLQLEKDNWDFFVNTILGYLWLIDKKFKIEKTKYLNNLLCVTYGLDASKNEYP